MTSEFRHSQNSSPNDRYYRFSYRQLRLTDGLRLTRPRLTNDTIGNGLPFLSPLSPALSYADSHEDFTTGPRVHGPAKEIIYAHITNFTIAINFNIASLHLARTLPRCTRSTRKHDSLCTIISNARSSILV